MLETFSQLRPEVIPPRRGAMASFALEADGVTRAGSRRADNEDSFLVAHLRRSLIVERGSLPGDDGATWSDGVEGVLLAVADGMSGPGGGALASSAAIEALAEAAAHRMAWPGDAGAASDRGQAILESLADAVHACQRRVHQVAREHDLARPCGTTLTLAYVVAGHLFVVHAGDSRCYVLRDGALRQLTADHTMAQRLIERHVLEPERAADTPFRNVLVNAVGGASDDLETELHDLALQPGDQILLCSDGLTDVVADDDIAHRLLAARSAREGCEALAEAALAADASDDVTAVVGRVGPPLH